MTNQQSEDHAHIHFRVDVVLDAQGEDHDYLAQRMNSALAQAITNDALTGDTGATVNSRDAALTLMSPEAASLDEEAVTTWLSKQIEDGHIALEAIPRLMARYALGDSASLREELAERMQLSLDDEAATPVLQET